jgi:hypothetical protein
MRIFLSIISMAFLLVIFAMAPAIAREGPDENEPNDTMAQADSIDGLTIEGKIDERDHDDWYVLEGQEGTNPTFTLTFDEDNLEIDWEIYSGEEVVATMSDWGSPESTTVEVPSTCYIHVWWWSGSGDYTIDIEPADTTSTDCAGEDEVESNDTKDLADSISGLEINGYACENDDDWYVLEGQEGANPTFTMTFDEDTLEIDWEIYSGDEVVASALDWGSPDELSAEVPGTCYIHVWWYSGEGEYKIEIEP